MFTSRSGRTGRAGRKGICVTLFSPKYRPAVVEIERVVGNKFEWAGAPQPADIVAASAESVIEVRAMGNRAATGRIVRRR